MNLLWKNEFEFEITNFSFSIIYGSFKACAMYPTEWFLMCLYDHPEFVKCLLTWDILRSLQSENESRWLVVGDFNEILSLKVKHEG